MSKISIVFDRLRTEEKMLKKEATELGHTAEMVDAKITQINTDTEKEDEKILTIESTGALNPEQIVLEGVEEVSRRVVEFKDMINDLKE